MITEQRGPKTAFFALFVCILREIYETQMHETFSIQDYYRDVQHIEKLDQYIKNKYLNSENSQFYQKTLCYSYKNLQTSCAPAKSASILLKFGTEGI